MTHHSLRLHAHRYANVRAKKPIGFNAKPVYRPPLALTVVGGLLCASIWAAIWIIGWVLLP